MNNATVSALRPGFRALGDSPREALERLGLRADRRSVERLPFAGEDVTAGLEDEWQAAVAGRRDRVDLPLTIESSDFYANLIKRQRRGEMRPGAVARLEQYLAGNRDGWWENSWVRLPERTLNPAAARALAEDLLADKCQPELGTRADGDRFFLHVNGERWLRVPVSYLLKLALVQATDEAGLTGREVACLGRRLSAVFTSDNTSPETSSLFLARGSHAGGLGRQLAREAAMRFLLAQLLVRYAEEAFELRRHGQRPAVFASPLPPVRQDELNECVSDSFYRELMMSPCLSGWRRGEEKMRYMHLCHEVLSRSQLNALRKLREAGIVNNNLVLLPTTSSLSLANNGTHLTLGSRRLTAALADPHSGFGPAGEKRVGDLVTKFVEHFLPLFPGVYSAAPRRLSFHDFHPERALGFLPHELDFSHLRMLWRRWRKKAHLRRFGWRWTPWGPPWVDDLFSRLLGLRGDVVPDARLIGYLACVMSTDQHPALDGELGNADRLKADLERMGVFDRRLSLYLFHRQREYARMGFSGFEGRWYSLFASLEGDLAPAAELQSLLTALAHQEILRGDITPEMIPDDPSVESERRQIVFAAAIGVPTVFIQQHTSDLLLRRLVERCDGVRASRRYPGCWRVPLRAWQLALVRYLRERGGDLINWLELSDVLNDLEARIRQPEEHSAEGRLVRGISRLAGGPHPLSIPSGEFNRAAERYYRETLRRDRCREGFRAVRELWNSLPPVRREAVERQMAADLKALGSPEVCGFLGLVEKGWEADDLPPAHVATAIRLLVCLAAQFLPAGEP